MRSVEQVHLKEIPERPHRLGSYQERCMRRRYVPDWGGGRASQPTAHAVRQAGRAGSGIAELGIASYDPAFDPDGRVLAVALACALMLTAPAKSAV